MSSVFPSTMSLSAPIRVGAEFKSPYQWAAKIAPTTPGALVEWKNALLWLEGESFGSEAELATKVTAVLDFLSRERGGPEPAEVEIEAPEPEPEPKDDGPAWQTTGKPKKPKAAKEVKARWTIDELAEAIAQESIKIFDRTFAFAGPSLNISDVYERFDPKEFVSSRLIGAVRVALMRWPTPRSRGLPASARYAAATSAGKGKNFNVKVQCKNPSVPNGYSAVAQVHVIWQ